jgi:acetyltransferase-like isoleucine patch superfamily enzyme
MGRLLRVFLVCLCVRLPGAIRAMILRALFGYDIHPTARIGLSYIDTKYLCLGPKASIGHFNVIRKARSIIVGANSTIGNLNWLSGEHGSYNAAVNYSKDGGDDLEVAAGSYITHRHLIDLTGGVRLGRFSAVSGYRTQLLTHSIHIPSDRQEVAGITIGEYSFIGTGCILLKGSHVPSYCVVGAGAVVTDRSDFEEYTLIGGVPARQLKALSRDLGFFKRTSGVTR